MDKLCIFVLDFCFFFLLILSYFLYVDNFLGLFLWIFGLFLG